MAARAAPLRGADNSIVIEPVSGRPAYAGIGARETPEQILELMRATGAALAAGGWTLRSGMSPGADRAFYDGALRAGGEIELYLPHEGFGAGARREHEQRRARVSELPAPSRRAYRLAARFCPDWPRQPPRARALLARDAHQVLGASLREPARLVICWTPAGDLDGRGAGSGGTGQALRIAHALGIEVLNLRREAHAERLRGALQERSGAALAGIAPAAAPQVELPLPGTE